MDQNGQAKSPETAPPAYFTEAMKRYARRVFDVYDPIGPNRGFKILPRDIKCYGPVAIGKRQEKSYRLGIIFIFTIIIPKKNILNVQFTQMMGLI